MILVFTENDFYMEDTLANEQLHFRFEKLITDGYKNNKLIYPNIINLKFLFDDTPATPDGYKKYSMNRYYGFYSESMDFVGSITSYVTPQVKMGLWLINNIIVTGVTGVTFDKCDLDFHWTYPSVNPFVNDTWDDNVDYYIFLDNTDDFYRDHTVSGLYPVKRVNQNGVIVWKIIANEIMDQVWDPSGRTESSLRYHPERSNMKTCNIKYEKFNILSGFTTDFFIDKYLDISGNTQYMFGDLYLINIDGIFHVLKNGSGITYSDFDLNNKNDVIGKYYIQTDFAINSTPDFLEYWIIGQNTPFYQKVSTYEKNRTPNQFNIYRIKFSDIKDFDFDRVDSDFAEFDFEKTEYVDTTEAKLHAIDYTDTSIPRDFKIERYGYTSQFKISNVSSEYVSDDELFELRQIDTPTTQTVYNPSSVRSINTTGNRIQRVLTDLWRKNQIVCKWGFMGSISHSDYAYKLNNSLSVGGVYNRITDPFYIYPDVVSKNMDYFYRIGNFYDTSISNKVYYKFQSTNIEGDYVFDQFKNSISDDGGFNVGAYFNTDFDYFTHFFKNKMNFLNGGLLYTRNYDKYAVFNFGDSMNSSVTLFKGLKVNIKTLTNIDVNWNVTPHKVNKILYDLSKNYNGYKFSIILNDVYGGYSEGIVNNSGGLIDTVGNGINIIMNEKFKNVLIIINFNVSSMNEYRLNDTSVYNEKDGLYYGLKKNGGHIGGYNSTILTAYNFIHSINIPEHSLTSSLDNIPPFDYIRYYYITEIGGIRYTGCTDNITDEYKQYNTMTDIPNWNKLFSPFLINIDYPESIMIDSQNNYTVNPYTGPDTRPIFGYSVNEPLARIMIQKQENQMVQGAPSSVAAPISSSSVSSTTPSRKQLFRFSGPYEPVFKDINIFRGGFYYYTSITGTTITKDASYCSAADYRKTYNYYPPTDQPNTGQYLWTNTTAMCRSVTFIDDENNITTTLLDSPVNSGNDQSAIFNTPAVNKPTGGDTFISSTSSTSGTSGGSSTSGVGIVRLYTQVNATPTGNAEITTHKLFVGGFNFGPIPPDAVISGITVTIKRRALNTDFISEEAPFGGLDYCYDNLVTLTQDVNDITKTSPVNYAISFSLANMAAYWKSTIFSGITYPNDVAFYIPNIDLLWGMTWTAQDIRNPDFGVLLSVNLKNNTSTSLVIPQIECITVCVSYTYNEISYTYSRSIYMDNNLKFDTGLNDFGMVDEFVYSKVNENQSILKINPNRDSSMYPIIDEYGYSYSSRFVFKSPWDKEFFVRTNSNNILNYQQMVVAQQQNSSSA
jgi:hypothetical protein